MSSGSNVLLTLAIARSVSSQSFGEFALTFAAYLIILGISRALATDPLVVRTPEFQSENSWRLAVSGATGTALLNGIWSGLLVCILGIAVHAQTILPFVAMAISMPFVLLQDAWRFVHFSQRKPGRALANDTVWTLFMIVFLVCLHLAHTINVTNAILSWASAALIACVYGFWQTGVVPGPQLVIRWVATNIRLSLFYVGESLLGSGSIQIGLYLVGILAGLDAAGAVKGGQTLAGPFTTLTVGIYAFTLPWFVARLFKSNESLLRPVGYLSAAVIVAAVFWGLALLAIPNSLGEDLLGATWARTQPLILPSACWTIALSLSVGPQSSLRARRMVSQSLLIRLIAAPFIVGGLALGATFGAGLGAMWGLAAGQTLNGLLWLAVCWHSETRGN
jgi:hypothetical protein